jgi:hypothetical protein
MRLFGVFTGCLLLCSVSLAQADPALAPEAGTALAHRVGDVLDYTLTGNVAQAIVGRDAYGRKVDQAAMPTTLNGSEHVAIKDMTSLGISLYRSGQLVAAVSGGKPVKHPGSGWTLVRDDGTIARDNGNLGGVFLLPLVFLGENAVNDGAALRVGDRWSAKLGTKLFGMTARPTIRFAVDSQHLLLGVEVFSLTGEGSAPMKEPIYSNSGEPLGYATGTARIMVRCDYDRVNKRIMSMELDITDSLHLTSGKKTFGTVSDRQRYLVSLEPATLSSKI